MITVFHLLRSYHFTYVLKFIGLISIQVSKVSLYSETFSMKSKSCSLLYILQNYEFTIQNKDTWGNHVIPSGVSLISYENLVPPRIFCFVKLMWNLITIWKYRSTHAHVTFLMFNLPLNIA